MDSESSILPAGRNQVKSAVVGNESPKRTFLVTEGRGSFVCSVLLGG